MADRYIVMLITFFPEQVRVMTVLKEYISECDEAYSEQRAFLPLAR